MWVGFLCWPKTISSRCKSDCFLELKQMSSLCYENEKEIELERQVAEQKGCTQIKPAQPQLTRGKAQAAHCPNLSWGQQDS